MIVVRSVRGLELVRLPEPAGHLLGDYFCGLVQCRVPFPILVGGQRRYTFSPMDIRHNGYQALPAQGERSPIDRGIG